jgi:hypothetical protein
MARPKGFALPPRIRGLVRYPAEPRGSRRSLPILFCGQDNRPCDSVGDALPAAQVIEGLTEAVQRGDHLRPAGGQRLHALPLRNDAVAPLTRFGTCGASAGVLGIRRADPHSFRKTLVRVGMEVCQGSAEAFKAWSQNLGHAEVLTTFGSYGDIPAHRQRDLIRSAASTSDDDRKALELGRAALAAARATGPNAAR